MENKKHMIVNEQIGRERKPEQKAIQATELGEEVGDTLQRGVAVKAREHRV